MSAPAVPVPRVAIPMLTLVRGGMGGSETYARELVSRLAANDRVDAVAVVPDAAAGFSAPLPEVAVPGLDGGGSTAQRLSTLASAMLKGRGIRRSWGDRTVVHYPFTVPAPRPPKGTPWIVTLHDVQHLDLPHLFSRSELAFRRRFYDTPAREADLVITVSEFCRSRIVEQLRIDPDRVVVAHLGVDVSEFVPFAGEREPFVLFPARGWPHKNHARLVEAMQIVRERHPDLTLVLTGGALDQLGELPEWVDRRGLVSLDELRELYRTASLVAFPSLYEGFGLPPLEAMASGCPVAVAHSGSLPEVVGDAAVLFDPHSVDAIAEGILEALNRGNAGFEAGLARAASFTWDRCVERHVEAYERAIETRS
ncbi:glycosyltransferase involved in cell wall biosynthesis [Microbacteriaceae bacterium SG_E_30_P1]|uniref:Glycosyltransferase involved in cell wall biosynthesis n=1 Tax=Antiquaquibacter oligotrophicus TaxID=2880260 RepID=A0ABT6KNW2_9MICO|nr:glycosyltransferase family 1 protein [Antiquaquibacter oligotrophicus]MDH6181701.1 glycosyltransferase involved in cell wall biosynthesis [Antiquaquibacter oligotrophicus]UDF12615.1 glycosyltransferase family 4 protein [Antiquaquibacter oligotrophicus]